ncbi:WPP domain-interacting protein 2-like [Tasmannia lanceolata]|uniref:WPP domain-interacting protein 2-like n=1 Tax=Tasmannia lanceolata TaxID=3420 RepID=UPI004064A4EA
MDLGDGSLRSRSEEEQKGETLEIGTCFYEIELGVSRPCDNEFGDLVSVEHVEIETVEKLSNLNDEKLGINGSCVEEIGDLGLKKHMFETSLETNEERIEIKKEVIMRSEEVGSPLGEACLDEIKLRFNGSFADKIGDLRRGEHGRNTSAIQSNGKGIDVVNAVETPVKSIGSPSRDSEGTPRLKGYGLRKWRRVRRDHTKDGCNGADLNRVLKRGLSNAEAVKARDLSSGHKQKSEGSVASVDSAVKNVAFSNLPVGVSDSESVFALGTDSENSEDQNSKSSTAASVPKSKMEVHVGIGFVKEKNKGKNFSGKSLGNAIHRAQHGKGKVETSKKLRGESVKNENDNSYSSVESDLRSSNAIATQVGRFPAVSNGRQSERSLNYDGENSDEVQLSEPQSSMEVRAACYKDNEEEAEDISRDNLAADVAEDEKKEDDENDEPNMDRDPLLESVAFLQATQEALEKEIQKFGEIGKEVISQRDDSMHGLRSSGEFDVQTRVHEPKSSKLEHFEETEGSSFSPMEAQLTDLSQEVSLLEHLLEETSITLKAKESKALELESILNGTQLPKKETKNNLLKDTSKVVEIELEDLFKKKIEAEIEYLMMTRTTRKLKVEAENQITRFEEQKSLVEDQARMVLKLRDTENKATLLKRQAEELETRSKELLRTEEVLKMQNSVCKLTLLSFIQFLMFCIVFGLFLLQLLPHSTGVVPT